MQPLSSEVEKNWKMTLVFFVCLGVIVTLGIVALVSWNRSEEVPQASTSALQDSPRDLLVGYHDSLVAVATAASSGANGQEIIKAAEQSLLAMRVPKEFLNDHFQALMRIRSLGSGTGVDLTTGQAEIIEEISSLLGRVDALIASRS